MVNMFRFKKRHSQRGAFAEDDGMILGRKSILSRRGKKALSIEESDDEFSDTTKMMPSDETVSNTSCDSSAALEDLMPKRCLKVRTQEESLEQIALPEIKTSRNKFLNVSFADVEIRTHEMILGDNPAVTAGPPLTITWDPISVVSISVDEFEEQRPPKKEVEDLKIPTEDRKIYIRDLRYTREQIQETMKVVYEIKSSRISTKALLKKQKEKRKKQRARRRSKQYGSAPDVHMFSAFQ